MLSISINAFDVRVLQVWEQMLPFQGSSNLYAATRFLHSRLCSQADIEKVEALQNVYTKPRSEIFIPSGKGCKEGICMCKPKSGALLSCAPKSLPQILDCQLIRRSVDARARPYKHTWTWTRTSLLPPSKGKVSIRTYSWQPSGLFHVLVGCGACVRACVCARCS